MPALAPHVDWVGVKSETDLSSSLSSSDSLSLLRNASRSWNLPFATGVGPVLGASSAETDLGMDVIDELTCNGVVMWGVSTDGVTGFGLSSCRNSQYPSTRRYKAKWTHF